MQRLVIIPTYNERENVARMIDKVLSLEGDFHLLFVDDGSPDGTAAIIKERQAQQPQPQRIHLIERKGKLGLGTAYIAGFRWALEHGYDHIFEMDCDFSHNPDDLLRLDRRLSEDTDVVIGSRYVRTVTRMPVCDATAGFVGYRREVLQTLNLDKVQMIGYGFQIEMKYTAWRHGFKLAEESIIFIDREAGTSKMSSGIFGEAFFGVLKLPWRGIGRNK